MKELSAVTVKRRTGKELFHYNGKALSVDLLSFWSWSSSDLVNNALRGMLAEFIVALALGCDKGTRTEWNAYDIKTSDGIKVEVKSAAYIQSWAQTKLSNIQFDIRPTQGWDADSNTYSTEKERQSDVYVFCVLAHKNKDTIDPLNLNQWEFYVISTKALNKLVGNQKTITLSRLRKLGPLKVAFDKISFAIEQVLEINRK